MDLSRRLQMKQRYRIRNDIPGHILFFARGAAIILSPTAYLIVQGIEANQSPKEIVAKLQDLYPDVSREQIVEDVLGFLGELEECDAIQPFGHNPL